MDARPSQREIGWYRVTVSGTNTHRDRYWDGERWLYKDGHYRRLIDNITLNSRRVFLRAAPEGTYTILYRRCDGVSIEEKEE